MFGLLGRVGLRVLGAFQATGRDCHGLFGVWTHKQNFCAALTSQMLLTLQLLQGASENDGDPSLETDVARSLQ